MGAMLLKFLRNNLLLVVPVLLAVGVLVQGAFQPGREEPTGTVETVNGVVSTPLVRFVDKSSWVYLSDYVTQLSSGATSSLALVGAQQTTGVFVEPDLLLTSLEAIETHQVTRVELADGVLSTGSVLGYDAENGVAIIKLNPGVAARGLGPGPVEMNPGWAVAVGLDAMGSVVTSVALLSLPNSGTSLHNSAPSLITNIHPPPGARGAAVLDLDRQLVGFIPAESGSRGIWGNNLQRLIRQMKNGGPIFRPWIGLEVSRMELGILEHLELSSGLLVRSVFPQGPAWRAGVRAGDILLELNENPLRTLEEYRGILASFSKGGSLELKVNRGSRTIQRMVEVGEVSEQQRLTAGGVWVESLGVSLKYERRALSPGGRQVPGLQVTYLAPGGLAYAAGIRSQDFILTIAGRAVYNSAQFRRQFERSSEEAMLVKLLREEKQHLVLLGK